METIIASGIAVLGTLLGSGITLAFQQRTTDMSQQFTRREKLRQERLDAYSTYAGALVNYRRCLVHLWFCEHEQRAVLLRETQWTGRARRRPSYSPR